MYGMRRKWIPYVAPSLYIIPFCISDARPRESLMTSVLCDTHTSSRFFWYCPSVNTVSSISSISGHIMASQTSRLFSVADAYLPLTPNINTTWHAVITEYLSQKEIEESLSLLEKDWDVDPVLRDFVLRRITDVADHRTRVGDVIFHIPYLNGHKKYVLWKCFWPDCHNCCERQGRLPLTSDDLVRIGSGLKYQKTSDFVRNETLTVSWRESSAGGEAIMTTVNLKRRSDETHADDGTHIPCRFLDGSGGCSMHPDRPGVCYLYPFSTWLENEAGAARVHASYQLTGDCPGFYLADDMRQMRSELEEYSGIIYDYNMKSSRTMREGFGSASF